MLNAPRNLLPLLTVSCSQFSTSFSPKQRLSVWSEAGTQGGVWEEGCASGDGFVSTL